MPNLTSAQVSNLAKNFLNLGLAVGEYRIQHYDDLTPEQNQTLKNHHWSLLNCSDDLSAMAAILVLNDVETEINQITDVTNDIKASYKTLQSVQKAIYVATSAVTLGASIISKNPQAIADAIGDLVDAWTA